MLLDADKLHGRHRHIFQERKRKLAQARVYRAQPPFTRPNTSPICSLIQSAKILIDFEPVHMDLVNLLIMMAEEKKTEWRNVLIKDMINILRENFDDASLEASMIRQSELNSISLPGIARFLKTSERIRG